MALIKLLWIFLCPLSKIVFVDAARQMEVCFFCHKDNDIIG
jgi:hypothetical protein